MSKNKLPRKEVVNNIIDSSPSRIIVANPPNQKKPIKWSEKVPWEGFSNKVIKEIEGLREKLIPIRKALQKGIELLNAIQSVVNLFKMLEMFYQSLLFAFLELVLTQLQTFIEDLRSTGIYVLDLTSYHFSDFFKSKPESNTPYKDAVETQGPWYLSTGEIEVDQSKLTNAGTSWMDYVQSFLEIYKKETYNEFINKICLAFLNENDTPDPNLTLINYIKISNIDKNYVKAVKDRKSLEEINEIIAGYESFKNKDKFSFLVGRPNFGPNAHMDGWVIAFCFPNILPLFTFLNMLKRLNIFPFNFITGQENQRMVAIWENFKNLLGTDAWLGKYLEIGKEFIAQMDKFKFGENLPQKIDKQEPFFMGINAGSLFGDIFSDADRLIKTIRNLLQPIDTSWANQINMVIEGIKEEIEDIIGFIDLIDQILFIIEQLLAVRGIKWLRINTDEGTQGVIEILQNAVGFNPTNPTEETYDDKLLKIKEKEDEINKNFTDQNTIQGRIKKAKYALIYEGKSPEWKPNWTDEEYGYLSLVEFEYEKIERVIVIKTFERYGQGGSTDVKIQKLYLDLWRLEFQEEQLKAEEIILWEEHDKLEQEFVTKDPGMERLFYRATLEEEIVQKNAEQMNTEALIALYKGIMDNLGAIQINYDNWYAFLIENGIIEKVAARDSITSASQEELDLAAEILDLQTNGKDLNSDGTKEWGLNQLKAYRDSIQLEYDHYLEGYDADADGIYEIVPIDTQIQSLQDQINALEAQQSDPNQPSIDNYEETLADLETEKANLENEKAITIADYESEIARFTAIIDYIAGLEPTEYQDASETAQETLLNLKNDADEEFLDSTAQDYRNQITELETEISNTEEEIADLEDSITSLRNEVNIRKSLIYSEDIDPNYYRYNSGFPGDNFVFSEPQSIGAEVQQIKVNGQLVPQSLSPIVIKAKINQVAIGERPEVAPEFTNLFLESEDGLWKYERQLFFAEIEKINLEFELTLLQLQLESLSLEYETWQSQNIIAQQDQVYTRNALDIEWEIYEKQTELNSLKISRESDWATKNAEINSLYAAGFTNYLGIHQNLYHPEFLEEHKKIEKSDATWNGNEALWLEHYEGLDLNHPSVKNTGTEEVPIYSIPDPDRLKEPEDSIKWFQPKYNNQNTLLTRRAKEIEHLEGQKNQIEAEYQETRKKELFEKKQERELWTPNTKMFYGGGLICWGWPSTDTKEDYFNWGEYWRQTYHDPDADNEKRRLNNDLQKQYKKIGSFF